MNRSKFKVALCAALTFCTATQAQTTSVETQSRSRPPTPTLDPGTGISSVYGTSNLVTPPNAVVTTDSATNRPVLSINPLDLRVAQERRTQPPAILSDYILYRHNDSLLRTLDQLKPFPNLDPTLPVLLAWNHVALDMTSIDHTTAGTKVPVPNAPNGMLPVFEPTYGEQFGPPRASRALAIVHLAVFEAINTIDPRYQSYKPAGGASVQQAILQQLNLPQPPNASTASVAAAISEAAYQTLIALYKRKMALLDVDKLQISLLVSAQEQVRGQADAKARIDLGTQVGQAAAAEVLRLRKDDNANIKDMSSRCGERYPGQPASTYIPEPLCFEAYFPDSVPAPPNPLTWTVDPILPNPLILGKNWKEVTPFVLSSNQFVEPGGLTPSPGHTIPVPKSTDARFKAALDDGAYGDLIPDPRGSSTKIHSKYGVRNYGAFNPPDGDVLTFPPGGGGREATPGDRKPSQTEAAQFWGYDATALLCAPPRLYNMIATSVYLDHLNGAVYDPHAAVKAGRYLALVNLALADAGITAWNGKFTYAVARPVTYIRDHLPTETPRDALWTPLGQVASNGTAPNTTPPFPAYPSGHSVFGAATFQTIARALGLNASSSSSQFDFVSDEYNGLTFGYNGKPRKYMKVHFRSLDAAKWENAESRVWLGVHWQTDADDGLVVGDAIADEIVSKALQPLP